MLSHVPRLVRGRRIDVIHAVEEASFIALLMKHVFRVPYVYDMDSSLPQQLIERYPWLGRARPLLEEFERRAIRGSLGVLAVSRSLEQLAREIAPDHLIARLEDFSLLEGGEAQPERGEPLRETTGCDGPIVLYAGNLMPYQGIDLLLAGFQRVARVHPTVQLVIIGGSDADIRTYRTRVADLGLQERVHLVGPRPTAQLGWYLGQANIVVSPRTTGTNTPMKVYSYLDSGTALLATRLPTHLQVLDDEIACLVAAEPEAIGEGLMRLLGDDELRRRLALRARERVRQEYSREAYLRKLNVFYDQVERRLKPAVGAEDADIPHASPARDELPVADR
jgi:glycosyltransferase involved in cell wall biosynthesis